MNLRSVLLYLRSNKEAETKSGDNVLRLMLVGAMITGIALFSLSLLGLRPALQNIESLEQERLSWEEVVSGKSSLDSLLLPRIEDLPDIVGLCQETFRAQGVDATSINMESVSGKGQTTTQKQNSAQNSETLEGALFRFRLKGSWPLILAAVSELEKHDSYAIHVQELILNENGGNLLLQIYYKVSPVKE